MIKLLLLMFLCIGCTSNVTVDDIHYGSAYGATAPKDCPKPAPGANAPYQPNGHKCSPPGTYPERHDDTNSATQYLNQHQYPRRKPPKRNDWTD